MQNHLGARSRRMLTEILELRRYLAWGTMPDLIDLDLLRSDYANITGQSQVIALLDTGSNGVDYGGGNYVHADISGRIWTNADEDVDPGSTDSSGNCLPGTLDGNDDDSDCLPDNVRGYDLHNRDHQPVDDNAHGTALTGIMVGRSFTHGGADYEGVAPGAVVLPLKVASSTGSITDSFRINEAIDFIVRNHEALNIVAVNLSLAITLTEYTRTDASHPRSIQSLVQELRDEGVFVAQAAGNSNDNQVNYPAGDDLAYAVGSLDSAGTGVWRDDEGEGTAYGTSPDYVDILAPGFYPVPWHNQAGHYETQGHTSYATAFLTATAALIRQVRPIISATNLNGTTDHMMSWIQNSSVMSITDPRPNPDYVYKVLDLDNAIRRAGKVTLSGTGGNDTFYIRRGSSAWADYIEFFVNTPTSGDPNYRVHKDALDVVSVIGGDGDDKLTVDFSSAWTINKRIDYNADGGTDTLEIIGTSGADTLTMNGVRATFGTSPINYDLVEKIPFKGGASTDTLNVAAGEYKFWTEEDTSLDVNISGSSSDVVFRPTNLSLNALSISGGIASVRNDATDRLLKVKSLSITGSSKLDLTDNDMIIDYSGNSPLNTINGYIVSARNTSPQWSGNGLTSSNAGSVGNQYLSLGIADNAILGFSQFSGASVDSTSVLVKFTYAGDANLSGWIESPGTAGGDFERIDAGYDSQGGSNPLLGWFNGDFNFDDLIDTDDYFLIDLNELAQTVVL